MQAHWQQTQHTARLHELSHLATDFDLDQDKY